ncbi:hypothetical protein OZX67_03855 [Bifidobacterium sp. ESL0728]|uniref:hypothetical protein n=1 Tax=Bifidobacterium sp. ESL0728 TaxID=2983220 RepID=UPI0023F7ACC9|nr:hypothetical protein [Bifidobacterium sp. ESL0728]WEV59682.1 hypothetical protein OZX67_03855 [Bifidobacterium sp. ESL0728]
MWIMPGKNVTVSLTDGSALTGRSQLAWPGRVRLSGIKVKEGEVPGTVTIYKQSIMTVQVV